MVVAARPGPQLSAATELDLVKAALLYGNKVTVISPFTTMLLRMEGLRRFSASQHIELMRRLAPVLLPPGEVADLEPVMDRTSELLRAPRADQQREQVIDLVHLFFKNPAIS
jgi:hypothetical protein